MASNERIGHGESGDFKGVSVSLDDLPKYGLVLARHEAEAVHQIAHVRDSPGEAEVLAPPCSQRDVEGGKSVDGKEYGAEYRIVNLRRRIPFSRYSLCQNPACFGYVGEVVEDAENGE